MKADKGRARASEREGMGDGFCFLQRHDGSASKMQWLAGHSGRKEGAGPDGGASGLGAAGGQRPSLTASTSSEKWEVKPQSARVEMRREMGAGGLK